MKKFLFLLALFLFADIVFPQQTPTHKSLLERIELLDPNSERALEEAKEIEKAARKAGLKEIELKSIEKQCIYYTTNSDFEKLMIAAESLFQKAKIYRLPVFQALAKRITFEAYIFSGLPEKAFQELEHGMDIIDKVKDKEDFTSLVRGGLLISYANYHSYKEDYKNELKFLKLAGQEYAKVQDSKSRERLLYINFSNLASSFRNQIKNDSAKYYALLSQKNDHKYGMDNIQFMNLWVLGGAEMQLENYREALHYFKKAEELGGYVNHINFSFMYDDIIKSYQQLQHLDSAKLYEIKKDALKLNISESQNKSLHKLLNKKENEAYKMYIYIFGGLLIAMGFTVFFVVRKNRVLIEQEKISRQYLEEEEPDGEDYSELLKMIKNNDPAFMVLFEKTFPEFTTKLLYINSKINSSEIEFCALLKLKITTKDISKFKHITIKSVQNRKYSIRKKLNIPEGIDIYNWFSLF